MSTRKHSFNWNKFKPKPKKDLSPFEAAMRRANRLATMVVGSIVAVMGGTIGFVIFDPLDIRDAKAFKANITTTKIWNHKYTVISPDVVEYKYPASDPTHTYTFDFNAQQVTIDGPDKADRVVLFKEYEGDAYINGARGIGCSITTSLDKHRNAFLEATGDKANEDGKDIKSKKELLNAFAQRHCKGIQMTKSDVYSTLMGP